MKNNIQKITLVLVTVLLPLMARANPKELINLLDPDYFGFEKGPSPWYFWGTNDYWDVVSEKASAGNYSMRFSHPDMSSVSSTVKAQTGGSSNPGAQLTLPAGTHTLHVKIWVEPGTTVKNFGIVIKNPWKVYNWPIDTVTHGRWVLLSQEITLTQNIQSDWQIIVDGSETGGGTFYLDEFAVYKNLVIPKIVPETSRLQSVDSLAFALNSGQYVMRLKVWKDAASTTQGFYTHLHEADKSLYWNLDGVSPGSWVELEQRFSLYCAYTNTRLQFIVPNNPTKGGGTGMFYVDELRIEPATFAEANNIPVAVAGSPQTVDVGEVTLNGSLSYDIDGDSLRYEWLAPEGITLNDDVAQKPTFVAPELSVSKQYAFVLTVNDGHQNSETDTVHITVKAKPNALNSVNGEAAVNVYPNPTRDRIYIQSATKIRQISIRSLDGRLLMTIRNNESRANVSIQHLQTGTYLLEMTTVNGKRILRKVVRE